MHIRSNAPLYHTTGISNAFQIINTNTLKVGTLDPWVSFSRDTREKYGAIQFIIDKEKLRYNYKVSPHMSEAERSTYTDSAEEIVMQDIRNFRNYLLGIDIINDQQLNFLIKKVQRATKEQIITNTYPKGFTHIKNLYPLLNELQRQQIPCSFRIQTLMQVVRYKLKYQTK